MRILVIQPNYHSGGAEITGNWPPTWVAYLTGALKTAYYTQVRSVDAMAGIAAIDPETHVGESMGERSA